MRAISATVEGEGVAGGFLELNIELRESARRGHRWIVGGRRKGEGGGMKEKERGGSGRENGRGGGRRAAWRSRPRS